MTITPEMEAEILRLFQAEGWRRGTIARQLQIHHGCVDRVLARNGVAVAVIQRRPAKIDPYLPFLKDTLEKYPKLNATRLHQMVKERGFSGGIDHFRDEIRKIRPVPTAEAYLRLSTLPGEQAQVDWGAFGKLQVGNAEHRLLAFVMVLSWSRKIYVRYYLGDDLASFLRAHVAAFSHFGYVPREILYDNLKTAVIERVENAIRFNPELLKLAAHYRFAPKPVPVARPTSKGRVERAIQYVRSSFFAARRFKDLADLNAQALEWCETEAVQRGWQQDKTLSVMEAFEKEKQSMLGLPDTEYSIYDRCSVRIGKTPYARFQGNDYSVPHTFARRSLLVQATAELVQIVDGMTVIAEHRRSYSKGDLVEDPKHIDALMAIKNSSAPHGGMNRILNVVPSSRDFFKTAAERGHNMGRLTQLLLTLLEMYGSAELEGAMHDCLVAGTIHSEAVRNVLEMRRRSKGLPPATVMSFLREPSVALPEVTPKPLDMYDKLFQMEEDE